MPLNLLTFKERWSYSTIPAEVDEPILRRYFIQTAADERLLQRTRGNHNRLGRQPGQDEAQACPNDLAGGAGTTARSAARVDQGCRQLPAPWVGRPAGHHHARKLVVKACGEAGQFMEAWVYQRVLKPQMKMEALIAPVNPLRCSASSNGI